MIKKCSLRVDKMWRTIRSDTIKNALINFSVPIVADKYYVISLRCLWDVFDEDLEKANYNLMNKREKIRKVMESFDDIMLYFSCLCAMESSKIRHRLAKRKRQEEERREALSESDEDHESYNDDGANAVIPGIILFSLLIFIPLEYKS